MKKLSKKTDEKVQKKQDEKAITVNMISDHDTLKNIIMLIAYIRDAIKQNKATTIKVNVAQNKKASMTFSVNDEQLPEYKTKQLITIN